MGEVGPEAGSRLVGVLDADIIAVLHGECFEREPWSTRAVAEIMAMPGAFGYLAERERQPGPVIMPAMPAPPWRRWCCAARSRERSPGGFMFSRRTRDLWLIMY
ncbi:MAG: hypothetical protein V3R22_02530 [Kiloniellales bacterium]